MAAEAVGETAEARRAYARAITLERELEDHDTDAALRAALRCLSLDGG